MSKVLIYTDGACSGNPGPGGWGAILKYNGKEKELSGGEKETTNNRMELQAVIEALGALTRKCDVVVYTDSKYVQQGMTEWLDNWKAKGWKGSNGKSVANVDLWMALDAQSRKHTIDWQWVKGHAGHPENERADQLAVAAAKEIKDS